MFVSIDRPPFHLWWTENFVKHRKVSKYYETDCGIKKRTIITDDFPCIFVGIKASSKPRQYCLC